jgi:RNA polymerase sigma factor (sigma-70 family)
MSATDSIDNHLANELTLSITKDVEAAKSGDLEAFERLICKTRNTVTSIALAIVKDFDNSEEVAQLVFIAAWNNLKSLKNNASFLPWIRQTTRFKAFNFLRDNKVASKVSGEQAEKLFSEFCNHESNHEDNLNQQQNSAIIQQLLSDLPEQSREIILLYYREEQSSKQVAQLLEISEVNVRKKLSRIREQLKSELMSKFGSLILSTAPAIGFSTIVLSAITHSTPVVAASMTASAATGKSSLFSKFLILLGGSLIGAAAAILAIFWSTKKPLSKMQNKDDKQLLIRFRNQTIGWVAFSGILLTLCYELSSGFVAPLVGYSIFAIGLIWLSNRSTQLILSSLYSDEYTSDKGSSERTNFLRQQRAGRYGIILGVVLGLSGMIIGLINSGRLAIF